MSGNIHNEPTIAHRIISCKGISQIAYTVAAKSIKDAPIIKDVVMKKSIIFILLLFIIISLL